MKLTPRASINENDQSMFTIDGGWTPGWVYIHFRYSGEHSTPLKLYWDIGPGFQDKSSEEIGIVDAKTEGSQPFFCYLPPEAKQLAISIEKTKAPMKQLILESIVCLDVAQFYSFSWAHTVKNYPIEIAGTVYPTTYSKFRLLKKIENEQDISQLAHLAVPHINDGLASYYFDEYKLDEGTEGDSLISVIIPIYQANLSLVQEAIESVNKQAYQTIELIVVVHQSMYGSLMQMSHGFEEKRIQVINYEGKGDFSELVNIGVKECNGERILLLHPHDQLTTKGLSLLAEIRGDIVYGDEIHFLSTGQVLDCYRKPAWSPDLLLAHQYISSGILLSKKLFTDVGGLQKEKAGAAEFDLLLRMSEKAKTVKNVSRAVYKKMVGDSGTSYEEGTNDITAMAVQALKEAMVRRKLDAEVSIIDQQANLFNVKYKLKSSTMVSIIICTRDKAELMRVCLNSIFTKTAYSNYEVLVVDNGSEEEATFSLFDQWERAEPKRFRVIRDERPFNFSALNNNAAKQARGDLLLLLNNDMEVITPEWLEEMGGLAIQERVGAVGAMLYYSENHVQHAGAIFNKTAPIHSYYKGWLTSNDLTKLLKINRNFLAVTGACLMVKKQLYTEVGGLDEGFESSYNDMHFCMQLHERGKHNVFAPKAELFHYESVSRGRLQTYETQVEWMRELGRFRSLWAPYFHYDPFAGSHTF